MLIKLHSFYSKLSLIFLVLILLLSLGVVTVAFSASGHLFDEVEQLLNRDYASSIALELQPFVEKGFSEDKVHDAIHYMMVLNPRVEIYLIDSDGEILAYFAGPGDDVVKKTIDLTPVNNFINKTKELPILGDDPRSEKSKKPFSASNLKMGNDEGYVYVILRRENYVRSLNSLSSSYYLKTGVTTILFATVLTVILGLLLFFILTKRLRDLNRAVTDFKNGNYNDKIKVTGSDELSSLGETFNQMAESIKKSEKQKNDLITNISHDLRSPLTSIRGHLETVIVKDNELDSKERKKYLDITLKNINNFQGLVDKLFELSKLENNQIVPTMEPFLLAELIHDVVLKLKPAALSRGIKIVMKEPLIDTTIIGDIAMIERVISNLLENALNYSPDKKNIEIVFSKSEANLKIHISDNGYGIKAEDLPFIFNRFYRGNISNTSSGTGLGLAIVKEIISLHKGKVEVESTLNIGTTFTISIPY